MPVYNKNGTLLNSVYGLNGNHLQQAYDINGNPLLSGDELTVMQYNVGQWYTGSGSRMPNTVYDTYSALHREIITANDPDIVAFEEYVDPVISGVSVASMIGDLLPNSVVGSGSEAYMKKAIYTKSLALTEAVNQNLVWGNLVRSTVQVNGKTIHIIATHWSNTASQRAQESALTLALAQTFDYCIVLGDINTTCMSVEDSDYPAVIKPWIDAGFHSANCSPEFGFYNTWFAGHNFETVDYESRGAPNDSIFTSPNITIDEVYRDTHKIPVCEVLQTRLDHAPLVAKLTVY